MTTPTTIQVRLQLRQDTAASWTSVNPTLLAGELGRESDTGKIKIGNGSSTWTALTYQPFGGTITNGDIASNAEIAVSKLADGAARQLLQTAANGTDVEWASNIDIPGTLDVTSAATFDSSVTVQGDLTVNGTTTTISTQNLLVEDKNIVMGDVATPTDVTADGGGITLKGDTDKTINWVDATDAWTLSEHVNIASAKEYRIAGTKVLDTTSLGSAVVSSSLTSVGTIGTGVWQGTAISKTYLDATLVSTGNTGTVTSTMILDGTIVNADINASAAIVDTKLDTIATAGKVSNSATTATNANTASAIVARDGSGNFSAGTITAALTGAASANVLKAGDTMTGVLAVTAGTAALPAITPSGDPNTGIYSPGADQVAISTNGQQSLLIDGSGAVLIPRGPLTLGPSGVEGGQLEIQNPLGTGNVYLLDANTATNARLFTTANNTNLQIGQITGTGGNVQFFTEGGERLRITSAGLVGIGTSTPSQLLTIRSSTGNHLRIEDSGGEGYNIYRKAADGILNFDGTQSTGFNGYNFSTTPSGGSLTSRLFIATSGNVGIGTTSPATTLDVNGDVTITDKIIHGGDTNTAIRFPAADTVSVETAGSERARIDSSGRLLVGTSSNLGGTVSIAGGGLYLSANDSNAEMQLTRASANSGTPIYYFNKARGTYASPTVVSDGDGIGTINFRGHDGSAYIAGASISAAVDGTPGTNDMPGRLVFSTTADGAISPTERMRISNQGNVFFDGNSALPSASVTGLVFSPASNGRRVIYTSSSTTAFQQLILFYNPNGLVGNIATDGSATSYNTSSDYRLKENVVPLTGAIDRLQQIPVHRFNFIADPDKTVDGFIAHEAQAIVPECVTGEKDEVDEEGNPVYQGIDQSKLVPLLTAALQEAIGRIETLEAEVAALKGA